MTMSQVKVVVFDLGNVLFDFSLDKIVEGLVPLTRSYEPHELLDYFVFPNDIIADLEIGKISVVDFFEITKKHLDLNVSFAEFRNIFNDIFTLRPKMIPILNRLKKKGIPLYILSNTNEMHFSFLRETAADVFALFDGFVLSYAVGFRKPEEGIYRCLQKEVAVPYGQIFFIDDLTDNIAGAQKLGIQTHHFKEEIGLLSAIEFI